MKYWAFISYSNKDRRWGQWMRRRLENYRISKDLRGREFPDGMLLDKRLRPVFLDRDELSSSADLSQSIKDALNESRCLVVLCSPHAANSAWVNKEVEAFRDMGKSERIFPVILAGEPNSDDPDTECFPPALRLPFEPLAADFRKSGDGKVRGFLKILAAIARLDLDQLYQRHERAARRSRFAWGTIALSLILVFGLLAVVAWWQRDLAQHANRISTARYLASRSQALRTEDIHLSRSLAAEGSVLLDSVETRRALFDTMQFSPSIYRFLATERQGWGQYVTISPDGEQAAYTSGAGDVWVWELDHKHLLLHLQTKNHRPIHFSNDGKFLYRVDQAGDVEKWRISTGEMVQHLDLKLQGFNFSGRAPEAFFHPDGSLVAITTSTQLRLFSLDSGKALSPLLPLKDGVDTLDFSADGKRAAYARDRLITLFEIQTGKIISQTKISDGYVTGLGLSPDLSQALAEIQSSSNPLQVPGMVGKSAGVAFIDLVNQKPASRLLPLHHGSVTSVVFSQDGRIVASGDREGRIVLLDADNHEMIELLHGHQKVITDISFSYDAKRMVSGDISGTAIVWDLSDIREENVNSPFGELIADRSARITSMDVVKSRNDIVVADNSGRVSLFDLDGVETERVLRSGSGFVPIAYTVSVGNKDNWIGAIDNQGQLTIWDMDGSLLMGSVIAHRSESFQHSAVDIHPLKALVATAGSDGQVLLWREANSEWFTEQLMEAEDGFTDVAFSHSGQFLAVASRERLIIWKLNGALSKVLELDSNSALAISFDRSPVIAWSPDDTHIAYGGTDGILTVWDIPNGKKIAGPIQVDNMTVLSLAYSADGSILAAGGMNNGDIHFWDTTSFQKIGKVQTRSWPVSALTSVGEGMTIVSGEQSGKLFSWNLSPEYLRKLISSSLRTGLSPQEWQLFLGTEFEYNPIAPAEITSPLVTATAPSVALPKDSPPIASQQTLELPQDTGDKSRDKDPTDMIRYLPMPEGAGYSVAVDHDVLRYSGTGDCKMVVIELGWNQSSESLNMDILESKEGNWGADMTVPEKAFHTGVQLAAWASCVDAESLETWIYEPVIQYEVIDDQGTLRRLPDRYLAEDRQTVQ